MQNRSHSAKQNVNFKKETKTAAVEKLVPFHSLILWSANGIGWLCKNYEVDMSQDGTTLRQDQLLWLLKRTFFYARFGLK